MEPRVKTYDSSNSRIARSARARVSAATYKGRNLRNNSFPPLRSFGSGPPVAFRCMNLFAPQ